MKTSGFQIWLLASTWSMRRTLRRRSAHSLSKFSVHRNLWWPRNSTQMECPYFSTPVKPIKEAFWTYTMLLSWVLKGLDMVFSWNCSPPFKSLSRSKISALKCVRWVIWCLATARTWERILWSRCWVSASKHPSTLTTQASLAMRVSPWTTFMLLVHGSWRFGILKSFHWMESNTLLFQKSKKSNFTRFSIKNGPNGLSKSTKTLIDD